MPPSPQYTPVIDAILKSSDLSTISIKKVRNGLAERTGIDFTPFKVLPPPPKLQQTASNNHAEKHRHSDHGPLRHSPRGA